MKKIFLIAGIIMFYSVTTKAQVGIGTNSPDPSAMLEVSSTSKGFLAPRLTTAQRVSLGATAAEGLLVYDTDTHSYWFRKTGSWVNFASGGSLPAGISGQTLRYNGSSWDTTSFLISTGSRIGIGNLNPSALLEITGADIAYGLPSGNTYAAEALHVKGGRGGGLVMQGGNGGYGGELRVYGGNGAGGTIHGGSGGAVLLKGGNGGNGSGGIGGNGGNIKLQAGNGGSFGSDGGNIVLLPGTGETINGGVGIGTEYPEETVDLHGAMRFEPIEIPEDPTNRLYNHGGSLFFDGKNLSETQTLYGVYTNAGNIVEMDDDAGDVRFYNDDPFYPEVFFLKRSSGFTGLGTTSPLAKLDVRYGIGMEFGDVVGINVNVVGGDVANGLVVANNAGGASGMGYAGIFSSSSCNGGGALLASNSGGIGGNTAKFYHGTTPDFVVRGDGTIGIGTNFPTKRFEINLADGTEEIRFRGSGGGASPYFFTVDDGDGVEYIRCDGGTYRMYMNASAIGVGTSDPSAKFHVNGSVRFENLGGSGSLVGIDGSGNLARSSGDSRIGSQVLNYVPKWNGSSLVAGSIFDNGNVGIGTSSVSGKFSVAQSSKKLSVGVFYGQGSMAIYTDDGILEIGDGAAVDGGIKLIDGGGGAGAFFSSSSSSFLYSNLGVGRDNPQYKLHVENSTTDFVAAISNTGSMTGKGLNVAGYNLGIETYSAGIGLKATSTQYYGIDVIGFSRAVYAHTSDVNAFSVYAEGSKNYFEGKTGIGNNNPSSKLDVVSTSASVPGVKITQSGNIQSFVQFQGTVSSDPYAGNVTNNTGGGNIMQAPSYDDATYNGYTLVGMVKVNVNGGEYWMPYYSYNGCGKSKASCPRVDAWINGQWVNVGRAIEHQNSREKDGRHDIILKAPAQKFRIVEDETEISHIHKIVGDGELWGLGEVTTTPAPAYGVDGFTVEFNFSRPVTKLETYGYYEIVYQNK